MGGMMPDLYETIGVDRSANGAEIKRAFRRRAKKAHPDTGGSAEEFAALNRAYLVLVDPKRRENYDRTGEADDKAVDNEHVQALQIIQQMMEQIFGQAADHIEQDLVAEMRKSLNQSMRDVKSKIESQRRIIVKLSRLAGKFRKNSGDNLLRKMVETKIDHIECGIETASRALANFEKAKAMLDGYTFDADPPMRTHAVFFGMSTATGTLG